MSKNTAQKAGLIPREGFVAVDSETHALLGFGWPKTHYPQEGDEKATDGQPIAGELYLVAVDPLAQGKAYWHGFDVLGAASVSRSGDTHPASLCRGQ